MGDREEGLRHYLEIWNGSADVNELDGLVTSDYLGDMGSRDRRLDELKQDIVAYRDRAPGVRFEVMHRFSDREYVATRVMAYAADSDTGATLSACGLNISRWVDGQLAEEWAVWEPLTPGS